MATFYAGEPSALRLDRLRLFFLGVIVFALPPGSAVRAQSDFARRSERRSCNASPLPLRRISWGSSFSSVTTAAQPVTG